MTADDTSPANGGSAKQSSGGLGIGAGGRYFGSAPISGDRLQISSTPVPQTNQPFRPLPAPTGSAPYHLSLETVLSAQSVNAIQQVGHIVFHTVGDTGGVKSPEPQQIVAMHMDEDFQNSAPDSKPAFFYHLGDVVYYYGEKANYYSQYYEPYVHYPSPILAIPGNHDGDLLDTSVPSLAAFVENFCQKEPILTQEAGDTSRLAQIEPNVYWTLEAPFVTIIGLYTNVPEGGQLDNDQIAWFHSELSAADPNKALIVALHHPLYSADMYHSGSTYMQQIVDNAIQQTGRFPDLFLTGHVHNYQRFTRKTDNREVPYIVAGAGGYWHLHYMQKNQGQPIQTPYPIPDTDVTLENYCENRHGFLRLEVSPQTIKGTYITVPRPQESWRDTSSHDQPQDTFTLDWREHRLQ